MALLGGGGHAPMNRLHELVQIDVYARALALLSRPYLRRTARRNGTGQARCLCEEGAMTLVNALGIGLGLLSIPVNAVILYLVRRAVAHCSCEIGMAVGSAFGGGPDDNGWEQ